MLEAVRAAGCVLLLAALAAASHAAEDQYPGVARAYLVKRDATLRMRNTRFADPCGHDRSSQYSSAADLARLAERVAQYEEYLHLSRLRRATISTTDGRHRYTFASTNALLGRYDGAIGLKTGFTWGAGHCLVALAERDGARVLVVLLNASNRWWHAAGLLELAFDAPP